MRKNGPIKAKLINYFTSMSQDYVAKVQFEVLRKNALWENYIVPPSNSIQSKKITNTTLISPPFSA